MNIFVAKLSPRTTEDSLKKHFEQFGEVTNSKVIFDRETGRSKCYGFVEMLNDFEGEEAIRELNERELEGNEIVVKQSKPRSDNDNNRGYQQRRPMPRRDY